MKKIISLLVIAIFAVTMVSGCGINKNESGKKLSIVTTIFPEYDWVKNIVGSEKDVDITMLLDSGVDLHSYQPSAEDILKISKCDMFVYVGGESDEWVEDALKEASNKNMRVVNLMDILGDKAKEEEEVEGMQEEAEHEEDGEHEKVEEHDDARENDEEHDETEYDEHVWLSLKNASYLCEKVEENLERIDKKNKETYRNNLVKYQKEIQSLDSKYNETTKIAKTKTLVFGDRFPFRYLTDDYGLKYYAAFKGCSAETEASFDTIKFLANKIDELKLNNVMTIDGSDKKIAKTIVENTKNKDQSILTLDSMQSIVSKDVEKGANYIDIMKKNLEVIKQALQ